MGQDDRAAVTQFLQEYASAFHNFEEQRVLGYYHEPLMFMTAASVRLNATRGDTEAWLRSFWARLKERGYARASAFAPLHVKLVSARGGKRSIRALQGGRTRARANRDDLRSSQDKQWLEDRRRCRP